VNEIEQRYDRRFPRERRLRAADPDREAVAAILRREHVAGRLDSEEFDDRLARCLTAKTYAELDALLADLPADEPTTPQRRRPRLSVFPFAFVPLLPIVVAALVFTHGGAGWLVFPIFFFVVRPLLWGRGGWGPRRPY
jgi:hypothetical protein